MIYWAIVKHLNCSSQDCYRLRAETMEATDKTLLAELGVMFITCSISEHLLLRVEDI